MIHTYGAPSFAGLKMNHWPKREIISIDGIWKLWWYFIIMLNQNDTHMFMWMMLVIIAAQCLPSKKVTTTGLDMD